MEQIEVFSKNVSEYEAWYDTYEKVYMSELIALKEQLLKLGENIKGIEVGLGTGRFSEPLGIKEGVEPSEEMARLAMDRGIEIIQGKAERLPYGDYQFDFVLFVTICHLDSMRDAMAEAYRVLKPKGSIIVGFLDRDRPIAQNYLDKRKRSTFFKDANFYTVHQVQKFLAKAGFKDMEFVQTLFGELDAINNIQSTKDGYGEGSFVVVKATKR